MEKSVIFAKTLSIIAIKLANKNNPSNYLAAFNPCLLIALKKNLKSDHLTLEKTSAVLFRSVSLNALKLTSGLSEAIANSASAKVAGLKKSYT